VANKGSRANPPAACSMARASAVMVQARSGISDFGR
jgi:hypothetical protein